MRMMKLPRLSGRTRISRRMCPTQGLHEHHNQTVEEDEAEQSLCGRRALNGIHLSQQLTKSRSLALQQSGVEVVGEAAFEEDREEREDHPTSLGPPTDKDGNNLDVVDDEVVLPEDPAGEKKAEGDVSTCCPPSQRDASASATAISSSPVTPILYKIIVDEDEKRDLIERSIIPHSYKGRAIGIVTARSVYREFGSQIVIGGKKIIDDYNEQEARDRGDVEGELADPGDKVPASTEAYNRNQYVAWHGASSVYHSNQPTAPPLHGKVLPSKRKSAITSANWMFEHAREASSFNSRLAAARRATLAGVYEPHTNMMFMPGHMQPTHARWSQQADGSPDHSNGAKVRIDPLRGTDEGIGQTMANGSSESATSLQEPESTTFPSIPNVVARNYLVIDTHFQTPKYTTFPAPRAEHLTAPATSLPGVSEIDLAMLPGDCRAALIEARGNANAWSEAWGCEARDGGRAALKIGIGGI
ncbi:hypothetical protein MRB53_040098 [Persea americana]|nr:hypothetical protein MRB53_040098 [Persea americana]